MQRGLLPQTQAAVPASANLAISHAIGESFDSVPDGSSPIVLSVRRLELFGTGTQSATAVTANEAGYHGSWSETNSCAKVATVTPSRGKGASFSFTVTGTANGKCALTVADTKKHKAVLRVIDKKGGSLASAFFIPLRAPRDKHGRRHVGPRFVSPSTQSMTVVISGAATRSVVAGLTALSPGCQLTLQGLTCQFGASLPSCPQAGEKCYTATVTMFDAYDPTTNTIPSGAAPLSISQTPFTIADNQQNSVNFNFSGIPAQIAVVPATPLVTQSANVFDLIGPGAHAMYAEAIDADNNVISGVGGPSYTVAISGASASGPNGHFPTVTQPPAGSPRFSITPPALLQPTSLLWTLNATATYGAGQTNGCAYPGAVCTGSVSLDMESLLAVWGGYSTTLFGAEKGNGPVNTISACSDNVVSDIEFDASGNLYVANPYGTASQTASQVGQICVFSPGSAIASRTIKTGLSLPSKMTTDASGNLYVLNGGKASVAIFAPGATTPSQTIPFPVPSASPASAGSAYWGPMPSQLAVDSQGDIWVLINNFFSGAPIFTNLTSAAVTGELVYIPHGGAPQTVTGTTLPVSIALDPATNTLYVSDETYTQVNQSAACGTPLGTPNYCQIETLTPASPTTAQVYSTTAYAGNLAFMPAHSLNSGNNTPATLVADDATGTSFSSWATGTTGPTTFSAWTSSEIGRGASAAVVLDELNNVYATNVQSAAVYAFRATQYDTGSPAAVLNPSLTITSGLDAPQRLAIVP